VGAIADDGGAMSDDRGAMFDDRGAISDDKSNYLNREYDKLTFDII